MILTDFQKKMEQPELHPREWIVEPIRAVVDHSEDVMMILTDFQKKMEQPELHPREWIVVQIPVHSLLLKQQRSDEPNCMIPTKHPQWNILPRGYLHRLCGQSPSGMTLSVAIPRQCLPPHQQGPAWKDH